MKTKGNEKDLDLFEIQNVKDFNNICVTSIASYKEGFLIGDSTGRILYYKKDKGKYIEDQIVSTPNNKDIESLICIEPANLLYALSKGTILIYELPSFSSKTPKDTDKEKKDTTDILKITRNRSSNESTDLLVVSKKKKIMFFKYNGELSRLIKYTELGQDDKPFEIILKDLPDMIQWYGNFLCYNIKEKSKLIIISAEKTNEGFGKISPHEQDLPADDIAFIQNTWFIGTGNGTMGLFFDTKGDAASKNLIQFNSESNESFCSFTVFNDLYIVVLYNKKISIYDFAEGKLIQEMSYGKGIPESCKKYMINVDKEILIVSNEKPVEKNSNGNSHLWVITELSFETQLNKLLGGNELDKALSLLNNKLDFNLEKFKSFENYYCNCAWNSFNQFKEKSFLDAEKYFNLCNFNPFELIYFYLDILKLDQHEIKANRLNKTYYEEIKKYQINFVPNANNNKMDEKTYKASLKLLINVLKNKKLAICNANKINTNNNNDFNNTNNKINNLDRYNEIPESIKSTYLSFDSSDNSLINLKKYETKEVRLDETMKFMNLAIVRALILSKEKVELIEEVIENDKFGTDYSENEFFTQVNTFESKLILAYINTYKNRNYEDALKILKEYIVQKHDPRIFVPTKKLLMKILKLLGDKSQAKIFEEGLKALLEHYESDAFDIILGNHLISIDEFLERILPEYEITQKNGEKSNSKREKFLKHICDNTKYTNYSNEKFHTYIIDLNLENLFKVQPKEQMTSKLEDKVRNNLNDFKDALNKYNKYNKIHLLENVRNTWMYDLEIELLTDLKKFDEAIAKYIELVKKKFKSFFDIREYCKINFENDNNIYKTYFQILKKNYYAEENADDKKQFKNEMLKLLDSLMKGELINEDQHKKLNQIQLLNILNPLEILDEIPDDWKLSDQLPTENSKDGKEKTLFHLLRFYLKEYGSISHNYKRANNIANMNFINKKNKLSEIKNTKFILNNDTKCYLCGVKISNNPTFMVYPNGHIYHIKCAQNPSIEPKTGRSFANFEY